MDLNNLPSPAFPLTSAEVEYANLILDALSPDRYQTSQMIADQVPCSRWTVKKYLKVIRDAWPGLVLYRNRYGYALSRNLPPTHPPADG